MNRRRKLALAIASGLGLGFAPFASGTVGALLGIPLFILFSGISQRVFPETFIEREMIYIGFVSILFFIGIWAARHGREHWNDNDPGQVVIDEIVGYLVTMFALPVSWGWILTGFLICRALDIIKPWPANLVDRRCPGAWGIMLDDTVSGIQGAVLLHVIKALFF